MATVRPLEDWRRVWWFPCMERRWVGLFLDTAPNVPVDINSFWYEWRFIKSHHHEWVKTEIYGDQRLHWDSRYLDVCKCGRYKVHKS